MVILQPSRKRFVVGRAIMVCVNIFNNASYLLSYLGSLFLFASRHEIFDRNPFVIHVTFHSLCVYDPNLNIDIIG